MARLINKDGEEVHIQCSVDPSIFGRGMTNPVMYMYDTEHDCFVNVLEKNIENMQNNDNRIPIDKYPIPFEYDEGSCRYIEVTSKHEDEPPQAPEPEYIKEDGFPVGILFTPAMIPLIIVILLFLFRR